MMYNVLEARNNLSKLIADVESGVEVTIARRGVPVARIVPIQDAPNPPLNAFGRWLEENPLDAGTVRPAYEIKAELRELREDGE